MSVQTNNKPKKPKKKDMITREELYRKFGPQLLEALTLLILDEVNILRTQAGLSERTTQQILNALENKLFDCPEYNWMEL